MGVVEASPSVSGVFIGCNGRHEETGCVRFIFLLVLDGSSQVHKCFELLYIRELTDTNGANVAVAEGVKW